MRGWMILSAVQRMLILSPAPQIFLKALDGSSLLQMIWR